MPLGWQVLELAQPEVQVCEKGHCDAQGMININKRGWAGAGPQFETYIKPSSHIAYVKMSRQGKMDDFEKTSVLKLCI